MSAPLVSILIPCRNAEPWLAATLESALSQTHRAIEIILVDDGSRDGSLTLARSFADRGVRIVAQPTAGASAARNRAFRESRGEYLQYLDADDLLSPGKIAAQVALLASRPRGAVASCAWGRFVDDPATAQFVDEDVFQDFPPLDFLVLAGLTGAMMHPAAWLVPRLVAEQAGPWNESLSLNDDGEYFCRVLLCASEVVFCDSPKARTYYRSGSKRSQSRQRNLRARRSQFHSLELITRHLKNREETPRSRRACAGYWRKFVHDFYPAPASAIRRAEAEVRRLGETIGRPQMGGVTAAFSSLLGWRLVQRLKYLVGR